MDYRDSGVNIDLGDDASKILYNAAKLTWQNRAGKLGEVVEVFSDFSGLRAIKVGGLPDDTYMSINFDGIGTKVELAERQGKHDTVAFDLFAMVCDDAVVRGAEPVIIGSILDVKSLGTNDGSHIDLVRQLATGYVNAAREANVAVVNGEVAELGARINGYGAFNYNWGAGVVWLARKSRMISGLAIKPGDYVVTLQEEGLRSNGLSLVRRVMTETYGNTWHAMTLDDKTLGDLALHPSRIYAKAIADMFGYFDKDPSADIHGVAHITGGGIPGKLGRALKASGYGARLHNLFDPCHLMIHCQELGNVSDEEAYHTWNMGNGMLIITPHPYAVCDVASKHGIRAKVCGEITRQPGIMIANRGYWRNKEDLVL